MLATIIDRLCLAKGVTMFRRIFGIYKKNTTEKAALGRSGEVAVQAASGASSDSANPVVPLHATQTVTTRKKDPTEVLNEAVDKLVDKLEGINDNLNHQVQQNQQLVERMDALPDLLSSLPQAVQEQRKAFAGVAEQLRQKVDRDEKVAQALGSIREQVAASVEIDTKMNESFGSFSESLRKLDRDTVCQTKWLEQINTTFNCTERYIKNTIEKQQTRFYWVLGISLGVCLLAVVGLVTGLAVLINR